MKHQLLRYKKFGLNPRPYKLLSGHSVVFHKAESRKRCCSQNTNPRYRFCSEMRFRNFTSAGFSASSVEKYHYPSDCHRRNRSNLLLIPGILAVLQCRSLGVPDKMAKIIRIKVLVNDLFSCQSTSERLPFSRFGINPFTCLKWESVFGGCFFKIS